MKIPLRRRVHIIGIGGIGMSAIAEIMAARGLEVQGSDQKDGEIFAASRAKASRFSLASAPRTSKALRRLLFRPRSRIQIRSLWLRAKKVFRCKRRRYARRAYERLPDDLRDRFPRQDNHDGHDWLDDDRGRSRPPCLSAAWFAPGDRMPGSGRAGGWWSRPINWTAPSSACRPKSASLKFDPEHLDYYGTEVVLHEAFLTFFRQIPKNGLAVPGIDHPVVAQPSQPSRRGAKSPPDGSLWPCAGCASADRHGRHDGGSVRPSTQFWPQALATLPSGKQIQAFGFRRAQRRLRTRQRRSRWDSISALTPDQIFEATFDL